MKFREIRAVRVWSLEGSLSREKSHTTTVANQHSNFDVGYISSMRSLVRGATLVCFASLLGAPSIVEAQVLRDQTIDVTAPGEAVATITAGCERCDWGAQGREAAVLRLTLDGVYSQHVLLSRGERLVDYAVLLGPLARGTHRLLIERDGERSAKSAGAATIANVSVRIHPADSAEHGWLSRAPFLHARPGTVEQFSDVPLLMYVEQVAKDPVRYAYTVIFSHEDGGTPTDRLMATWGRSTDIEYVYGVTLPENGGSRDEDYQGRDHAILPFKGSRVGAHPLLWVSTHNNMVSDTGPSGAVRFAPAPRLVRLEDVSRELVMDDNPWLYALMTAELAREQRIDPGAAAGGGKVADPRRYAVIEACGNVNDATIAFDVGLRAGNGDYVWHPSEGGDPRFRIARSGCFRSAVRLPENTRPDAIGAVRARVFTRPPRDGEAPLPAGHGRVELQRLNTVFMLDEQFKPVRTNLEWTGSLTIRGESPARIIRSQ